jgi:hypothetical protein
MVNPGAQGAAFSDCLADAICMHKPSLIMIEADVNLHRQNPGPTAYQQLGMLYLAELICYRREVRMRIASATEARMTTIGRARWAKGEAKNVVAAWVADQGMRITDHNISDAYVLWRHACQAMEKRAA